jgi:antitoxin component YwqK of YwqJK toxin-antitoxin module
MLSDFTVMEKGDGLFTFWYENGQKERERTYRDGELIVAECWDEDGNECECGENWWEGCK